MGLIIFVAMTAKHIQNVMPCKSIVYLSLGLPFNQYMLYFEYLHDFLSYLICTIS